MTKRRAGFRSSDVVRLVEAARAAGLKVACVEVTPDGTLRAVETSSNAFTVSDFDRFEAEL